MKQKLSQVGVILIILMFAYASIAKLSNLELFRAQMGQSPLLPLSLIPFFSYFIPAIELVAVALLIIDATKVAGLYLTFFIMAIFSVYLVALVSLYDNVPCACGGILGKTNYPVHIVFNIIFTIIPLACLKGEQNDARANR
ncbi:MauE/DoxX family redox-associated membrane protein [Flavihumibacter stibioxidans]|uniref:Methylamine utilisation protein MauE domain-containing protein n=1 Tax=Flavihumibacter stibioxidans TaxID=1834163 RepID=A0ABR7M9J1_9BACT|nr:MauE/DoxX family redox-associated membrane protein [Flavihumibacter stibioxidans]MBC6491700.1 hypothetical protein [Flavihumibacter stibioxidans]